MKIRALLPLIALCVSFSACHQQKIVRPEKRSVDQIAVARVISGLIGSLDRRDFKTYITFWHPSARMVRGRTPRPGQHDVHSDYKSIVSPDQMLVMSPRKPGHRLGHRILSVAVDGTVARARVRLTQTHNGVAQQVLGESYRLRRTSEGWKVTDNRFWSISRRVKKRLVALDNAHWAQMDRLVEMAQRSGDVQRHLIALYRAGHLSSALKLANKLVKKSPRNARLWFLVGRTASTMGRWRQAVHAYRRTASLNPELPVPERLRIRRIDAALCAGLQKQAIDCRLPSLFIGVKRFCNRQVGKYIKDYQMLKGWTRMSCTDLRYAWGERMRKARLRIARLRRRYLENTGVKFCHKFLPLNTTSVACYYNNAVTSLEPLRHLKYLKEIRLVKTPVHDLSPLYRLDSLKLLSLKRTPISRNQINKLKQVRPELVIRR